LHAAAPIILLQESILNLCIDAMEPLLGPIGFFLMSGKFCLQLGDPIFSRAKLMWKPLRRIDCMSAVLLGNAGRFMEQLQDSSTRFVELIGPLRRVAAGSSRIPIDLTMHC
jgi:hypothetical protein